MQKQVLKRIIIDPGHGGQDIGAKGRYSTEKDISLAVSLKLEQELKEQMPDVEVVLTRKTDIYHSVVTKARIANQAKGDLFVCIHVNSADPIRNREFVGYKTETYYKGKGKNRKKLTRKVKEYRTWYTPNPAKGTETFIYGVDKTEQRKAAASEGLDEYMDSISAREIKALEQESSNDPTKRMLANVMTQQYFQRSAKLALTVEEEFQKIGRISRQAQQRKKGIWVLQAVSMPAVLVETGFISNPDEEDYLNSEQGQKDIAEVITRSLRIYKLSLEKQLGITSEGSGGK
ncbi:N-acetylmuramoyl-L-alanine amidase family protein [Sediminibacterium ginsengisoli]|nr:N-acetylmuramoyl-L-alanine amidase [Sediminibacterium ginsengisoli]